jgi:tRNA A-37 threonylcarbamoyl transferase component Bud32
VEESRLSDNNLIRTEIYQERDSGFCTDVKSRKLSIDCDKGIIERTIENLMNLRHPCIGGVIGVVLPLRLRGLRIVRKHFCGDSLSTVVLESPEWWTPTARAKAVVGVVLGLRFVHSLGLVHGHLTGNNVFFNEDGIIQICDFSLDNVIHQECDKGMETDVGHFSREHFTPTSDFQAFTRLLSEIVSGASAEQGRHADKIPPFLSEVIKRGQYKDVEAIESFTSFLTIFKQHDFNIIAGANIDKVFQFVREIELSETVAE